jgi:hypothetical protein
MTPPFWRSLGPSNAVTFKQEKEQIQKKKEKEKGAEGKDDDKLLCLVSAGGNFTRDLRELHRWGQDTPYTSS